jgi:carbon monoxide dehydrogenase subunit G
MVHVVRTFTVTAPPTRAVGYLADFAHAEAWDPGTRTCVRIDDGPVGVGATWRNTSKILGSTTELDYRLTHLDSERIELVGENKTATATDVITVRPAPDGSGSEITYDATVVLHGVAKLGSPLMQLEFEKLGDQTVDGIQRELGVPRG